MRITRLLVFTGYLVPFIFWCATITAGVLHGNYNHFRDTVSELGAIGTRSEYIMTVLTWLSTAFSVVFFAGMSIACKQFNLNRLPLVGIVGFALMFGWAAVFHSGNPMHSKSGPTLLLLLMGPILTLFLWKDIKFKSLRKYSLISFLMMLLILLRVVATEQIQQNYTGLIQRFVHLGWSLWFVALTYTFLRLIPANNKPVH